MTYNVLSWTLILQRAHWNRRATDLI